jgi:uncharacterized membrane protein
MYNIQEIRLTSVRLIGAFIAIILLGSAVSIRSLEAQYTVSTLSITLESDGFASVEYRIATDPTTANITVPLIGKTIANLVVTDHNQVVLNYQLQGEAVMIFSLGSSVEISYDTPSLTNKVGDIWDINVTSPVSLSVRLPQGATLVSLSQIPLEISTIDQRQNILLPEGVNEISYLLGIVGTKEHSLLVITDAEASINQAKSSGLVTAYADNLLTKAKNYYNAADYYSAEDYAVQAKNAATTTVALADDADANIKAASTLIDKAKADGRTNGVELATSLLNQAVTAYDVGNYSEASSLAAQAVTNANSATRSLDQIILIAGIVVLIAAVTMAVFLLRRKRGGETPSPPLKGGGIVDLESIYRDFPDLREEDRQMIKLLADSGGQTYADIIREKLQMPKTSAWRMIRRLLSQGIVGERKVGLRSLVYIEEKYRKKN